MARLFQVAIAGLAVQASFGPDRRQGLGVGTMLAPAADLWPTLEDRRRFLLRHLENFNTNPAMAGPLMGAVVRFEELAAAGDVEALERLIKLKRGLEGPFAAAGDRLLWVGIRSCAAVVGGIVGWMAGGAWAVFCFLVLYNIVHLGIRLGGVFWGYRHAEQVHELLRSPLILGLTRVSGWVLLTGGLVLASMVLVSTGAPRWSAPLVLVIGWGIGSRGDVRGTPVAAGGILVGLILAYGLGSEGP